MLDAPATSTLHAVACPACGGDAMRVFFEQQDIPVFCNVLHATREEARNAPRGNMRLAWCDDCGMVHNLAFDPGLMQYDVQYENSLHFSPRFAAYAEELEKDLIQRYNLRNKQIVEIGCGKGDFLLSICKRGDNRGLGFDPSYEGPQNIDNVRFIQDYYAPRWSHLPADMVICRHVLEHIPSPREFLSDLHDTLADRRHTAIFFEVPNLLYTLRDMGIWDLIYEHCNYFSPTALCRVFEKAGLNPLRTREVYGGQFLTIEAAIGGRISQPDPAETGVVDAFDAHYRTKVAHWNDRLARLLQAGRHVAVWGAGSKGVTFINTLDCGNQIQYVVDINPRKVGRFIAGAGQKIINPTMLPKNEGVAVLVMNPLYRDEIAAQLSQLDDRADVEIV